jgi:hypothetical protein
MTALTSALLHRRGVLADRSPVVRRVVGGFYLVMAGVHLGIVASDAQTYRHFADGTPLGFVRAGWSEVFMRSPEQWGLALFLGETVIGVLLLLGGRAAKVGWAAVIAFHLLLMLFGFGIWLWSVPVLLLLTPVAVRDWVLLSGEAAGAPTRVGGTA